MAYRWKQWEIDYLYRHAGEGVDAVAKSLGRTPASVRNQASSYGISLRHSHICERCGHVTHSPLNPVNGWCRACSLEASRDKAAKANAQIRAEVEAEEKRLQTITRERQAYYASTHRYKKRLRKLNELQEANQNLQAK